MCDRTLDTRGYHKFYEVTRECLARPRRDESFGTGAEKPLDQRSESRAGVLDWEPCIAAQEADPFSQMSSPVMFMSRYRFALGILAAAVLLGGKVEAQPTKFARTTVFGEAGGNAWLYSINADYRIRQNVSIRAGGTAIEAGGVGLYGGPLMVNALPGWKAHRAEIGAGMLLGYLANRSYEAYFGEDPEPGQASGMAVPTFSVGYRYQQPTGGLFLRVVYTPVVAGGEWSHWGGIGVGYTFLQ